MPVRVAAALQAGPMTERNVLGGELVAIHGGRISASNRADGGAVFDIVLPSCSFKDTLAAEFAQTTLLSVDEEPSLAATSSRARSTTGSGTPAAVATSGVGPAKKPAAKKKA